MSRAFCIPGIVFLVCALVLNFFVSISLPFLPALDIARTHFNDGTVQVENVPGVNEIRYGIWAPCYYNPEGDRTCLKTGNSYDLTIGPQNEPEERVTIGTSWTRGLVIHPLATAVTLIALCLSFSTHLTVTLVASLVSFLAALLTLIAFACDIALYAWVKRQMSKLDIEGINTNTAPGFWMTLVSFVLLVLAGFTVCFGRRRDRMASAVPEKGPIEPAVVGPKPSFFSRFRRTKA